jgi:hypothetical protein
MLKVGDSITSDASGLGMKPLFSSEFSQRYPRTAGCLRLVFVFLVVICAIVGAYRIMLFVGVDHE